MNRVEFLEKLRQALDGNVSSAVVNENVNYYHQYIADEMAKGRSEQEVLEELGDPWLIAKTIIDIKEQSQTYDGAEYEAERRGYTGQEAGPGHVRVFAFDSWWKRLLGILCVVGIIFVIFSVITGIISLVAPILVPVLVVVIIVRMISGRRR
ncbi:DUF1700 domain-containing protein [Roseburia hominis]